MLADANNVDVGPVVETVEPTEALKKVYEGTTSAVTDLVTEPEVLVEKSWWVANWWWVLLAVVVVAGVVYYLVKRRKK